MHNQAQTNQEHILATIREASAAARAHAHPVPPAWYDLSCRVTSAKAVIGVCIDHLPAATGEHATQCETTGRLVCAVNDLLELCERDVLQLEQQLLQLGRSS